VDCCFSVIALYKAN